MPEQKHTPGPYEARKFNDTKSHSIYTLADGTPFSIATVKHKDPEIQQANARLIAAAPELLEALKDATLRLQEFIGSDCECDNTHSANNTTCCLCSYEAAIAKAEGRSDD